MSRKDAIEKAKIAESAERYDDMAAVSVNKEGGDERVVKLDLHSYYGRIMLYT